MTLFVAMTVDIDNDSLSLADERNQLSWRGLELVPRLADMIHAACLPVTWFVRADPQLSDCYGSAGYLLEEHQDLWRGFSAAGDEIAWHPHILSLGADGVYVAEHDDQRLVEALERTHAQLLALGHRATSVRMGEAVGSNAIMETLAKLGLRVDSSAIPGRRRNDASRAFDWSSTPNTPYRPSRGDYRVSGEPALPILEVPMTAVPVQAPQEPEPLLRYASLAYHPAVFSAALERWFALTRQADAVLTLILHPDELMPSTRHHPLYAFAPDALRSNIETLIQLAHSRNIEVAGCTITEVEQHFSRKEAA